MIKIHTTDQEIFDWVNLTLYALAEQPTKMIDDGIVLTNDQTVAMFVESEDDDGIQLDGDSLSLWVAGTQYMVSGVPDALISFLEPGFSLTVREIVTLFGRK